MANRSKWPKDDLLFIISLSGENTKNIMQTHTYF
jgi:hypothetical protein